MAGFSLKDCLIPELRTNKIDFNIVRYEDGNAEKPISLIVYYTTRRICKIDRYYEIGSSNCYEVEWYSGTRSYFSVDQYYARAYDLVRDICKVIKFILKDKHVLCGRGNGKTRMYCDEFLGGFTTWRNEYQKERDKFDIKDVIFNSPATIVLWADGTKTVVKAENEIFDPEKGLAMAIAKKALGNNYGYYDVFKKYVGKYWKKQKKG